MTKDKLLSILWQNADTYISGEEMAKLMTVSRTAVWKAIRQLREEGYAIESVPNRGYRLLSESDVLSEDGIRRHLHHRELQLRVYDTITSTNTVLKTLAAQDAPAGLALIAGEQTAGRGRLDQSRHECRSGHSSYCMRRRGCSRNDRGTLGTCGTDQVGK